MAPEQFVYWLQGFAEIQNSNSVTDLQWQIIKDHLNLVFKKETPNRKVESLPSVLNAVPVNNPSDIYCGLHSGIKCSPKYPEIIGGTGLYPNIVDTGIVNSNIHPPQFDIPITC